MKKISLSIPEPCHENWDRMSQAEKGKFCTACQKTVVDFTNMSDRELAEFFKRPSTSVCGRFFQDQLNRDLAIPRKRIPWIKYFFQFSLPALLASTKATAQGGIRVKQETTTCTKVTMGKAVFPIKEAEDSTTKTIQGKVTDTKGQAISFATVMIKGTSIATSTDAVGNFSLRTAASEKCMLQIFAVGFQSNEVLVRDTSMNITLAPVALNEALTGAIVVVRTKKEKKKIPLMKRVVDTTFKNFSVYPNPVQNNSSVKINLKKFESGNYTVSIINMAGEVVQTEEINVESKQQTIDLHLNETTAGTYFVHLFNRKTAASYSEKIVVQ